jgi:integrase
VVTPGTTSTEAFLERWLEGIHGRVGTATYRHHKVNVARAVKHIGRIPLAKLTPSDVERMTDAIIDAGSAPMTARHTRGTLRLALAIAERDGLVARNVARLARPPRAEHKEMTALDAVEVRRLLEASKDAGTIGNVVAVAVMTGLRQGELLGLCRPDVDTRAATATVRRALKLADDGSYQLGDTKTGKSRRTVNLPAAAVAALERQLEERGNVRHLTGDDLVFADEVGRPLKRWDVTYGFQALLDRAGIRRIRFHDLRHTYATLALSAGVPLQVVSRALGHSTIAITANTYSHVVPDQMREAANALDRILGGRA